MDRDGLKIGVLISQHDAGLDWWTEDEILQERTAIILHVHCFWGGGIFQEIYTPNFEQTKFFVEKGVVQEKTNDGGTKWITERNEKKLIFYWMNKFSSWFWNKKIIDFLINKQFFEKN